MAKPHKLLSFSEDSSFMDIQDDFYKLFGTPNFFFHSNLCDVSRKASFKMVMGHDRPLIDAVESKYTSYSLDGIRFRRQNFRFTAHYHPRN